MAAAWPGAQLHVFEANPRQCDNLEKATARVATVHCPVGLANATGVLHFRRMGTDDDPYGTLQAPTRAYMDLHPWTEFTERVPVPVQSLADACRRLGRAPDLLLLDLEGAEFGVLAAAPPALLANVSLVSVETRQVRLYERDHLLPELVELLGHRGFTLLYVPQRKIGNFDAVFVRRDISVAALR